MRTAIRKHIRDFVAIAFLVLLALGVAGYILSNERFYLPAWVPGLGTDFYNVNAEFSTAQAVVPGQGQTVNIAGVQVGDIGDVKLRNGRAVVQMKIRKKYAPIYKDATLLLRPKTGLKDMYIELMPGSRSAGEVKEGDTLPVSNSLPDVNFDEILAELDTDTRQYLQILINAGGEAFGTKGYSADLRETFKRFEPTARYAARITGELSKRRRSVKRVIHNFQLLSTELAKKDDQLAALVDSSNANFQAFANQDRNLRAALRQLPGTLETARSALGKADALADELGPTTRALLPAARALGPALRDTRPFLRDSTPIIRDQLRPFAREARPPVRSLRAAAEDLAPTTPRLTRTFKVLNSLFNTLTYNPPGPEEGYLFWASWVNHAGASIFSTQDAHGPIRRGLVLASCLNLGVLNGLRGTNPQLAVLIDLLNAPKPDQVCTPGTQGPPPPTPAPSGSSRGKR
jgi:phospholipid/cholesterol/gamma-HCH transport system substrate-binding protein